jgi:hypothetical protein
MEQITMKKALISSLALGSLLWGAGAAPAANLTIDNFNEPLQSEIILFPTDIPPTASSLDTGLPTNSVIGGTRLTNLTLLDPLIIPVDPSDPDLGDNEFAQTEVTSGDGTGVLDQSIFGAIGNFSNTSVTWNRGGTGLGQSFAGFDRFKLDIERFSLFNPTTTTGIGTITLKVRNSLTGAFSSSPLTLNDIPDTAPTFREFLFSGFSDPSVFNSSIAEIQLEVITGSQPGLLFTLGDLVAVSDGSGGTDIPEPSLVLGCFVLAGTQMIITGWRQSRKEQKKDE